MISCALTAAGHRKGLYTSPHLERLEERICIDGGECSKRELVNLVRVVRPVVEELDEMTLENETPGNSTFFEITTAMALLHFVGQAVDIAVLEVGLGGRLDSTNVCQPVVTVITSISFDHVQQLGNTLSEIAREKAGIVKPGIPLICGVTDEEPRTAIEKIAEERAAPMTRLGKEFEFQYARASRTGVVGTGGSITYRENSLHGGTHLDDVQIGMLGAHQAANAAVAIATLHRMQEDGWTISEDAIRHGIANASCRARIEILSLDPLVVLDTAHNVASIAALLSALDESFGDRPRVLLFAATRDKDVSGMLRLLLPQFDFVILTRYVENPRGVPPDRLLELVNKLRAESCKVPELLVSESPVEAWQKSLAIASGGQMICVTGSFFLAAELRSIISATLPTPHA